MTRLQKETPIYNKDAVAGEIDGIRANFWTDAQGAHVSFDGGECIVTPSSMEFKDRNGITTASFGSSGSVIGRSDGMQVRVDSDSIDYMVAGNVIASMGLNGSKAAQPDSDHTAWPSKDGSSFAWQVPDGTTVAAGETVCLCCYDASAKTLAYVLVTAPADLVGPGASVAWAVGETAATCLQADGTASDEAAEVTYAGDYVLGIDGDLGVGGALSAGSMKCSGRATFNGGASVKGGLSVANGLKSSSIIIADGKGGITGNGNLYGANFLPHNALFTGEVAKGKSAAIDASIGDYYLFRIKLDGFISPLLGYRVDAGEIRYFGVHDTGNNVRTYFGKITYSVSGGKAKFVNEGNCYDIGGTRTASNAAVLAIVGLC